jgi:predicted nucleic acid-binding protein
MPVEAVIDASVLAAVFFKEPNHEAAARFLASDTPLIAPSLLCIEMASIAAKKVWLGEADDHVAREAVIQTPRITTRLVADSDFAPTAYELARDHRFSAYDATYLALADTSGTQVVTLDGKLARRAEEVGLAGLVRLLT